jgi:glutamate carboxypeptidase
MTRGHRGYLEAHRGDVLELLRSLVEVNSFTRSPEGVNAVGAIMAAFLGGLGFHEQVHQREGIGHHQVFARPGGGARLLFLTHKDTVFPADTGFLAFTMDGERAVGPGVIDMKGGITVLLYALKMLGELGEAGDLDIAITAVSDEEAGSEDSRKLTEACAIDRDYAFCMECGGPDRELVSARKGVGTFFIDITGKAAHAGNSYAQGVNANLELARKTIAIQALTDLEQGTTVNVGEISGGIGANTISPSARMTIDLRFEEPEEGERIRSELERIAATPYVAGTHSRLSGVIQRPVMVESPGTRGFIEVIERATGVGVQVEHRGGVSDANFTAALGIPTLDGFGPIGGDDHRTTEYMLVGSLFDRIELLGAVLGHLGRQ